MKKTVKNKSWQKNWEGKFSFLAADLALDCYYEAGRIFKSKISSLVITKKGISACYLDEKELSVFGKKALLKIKDIGVEKFTDDFRKFADELYIFLNSSPDKIDNKFEYLKFEKILKKYSSYQITNKEVANHLSEKDKKYFKYFEEARKYSERAFVDLENFINKVNFKEISLFTKKEFKSYIVNEKIPNKNKIKSRSDSFGVFINNNERFYLNFEKIKEIENYWKKNLKTDEITGKPAYRGIISGKVRVIINLKEKDNFKQGEILVTGMTDPDFVPIINKASAIITDAGGLLCHAAIIAREMKKPCIIGTKIATQVLKDGDLVEVDANKGIVKIIK